MSIQWNKVGALFRKDLKDALKNTQCILMIALPIFFVLLYGSIRFGDESMSGSLVFTFGLLMNLSILPVTFMSMMIAEEKEKFTLRTLMLSNVSAADFLISKALVVLLLAECSTLVIYGITRPEAITLGLLLPITVLTLLCLIMFGSLIGIISKNQMSTGLFAAPAMLLFLLPAMLAPVNDSMASVARFMPTQAMMELLSRTGSAAFHIAVLVAWMVLGAVLFMIAYRRKQFD
ncbi:MAG: ABC transporter permease [Firmicutes bacterium]|nr:ABC transporter permease [Bacillota bacterium]